MGYASKSGRARTSPSNPQAFAVCDRCGIWYNHVDLKYQFEWRGATLQNIQILVDIGLGKGKATVWTCDLTHAYIDINGSYRT